MRGIEEQRTRKRHQDQNEPKEENGVMKSTKPIFNLQILSPALEATLRFIAQRVDSFPISGMKRRLSRWKGKVDVDDSPGKATSLPPSNAPRAVSTITALLPLDWCNYLLPLKLV